MMTISLTTSRGLLKFQHIKFTTKAIRTLDGRCCFTGCKRFCEISLSICLYTYTSTDVICLITGTSNVVLKNQTKELDVRFFSSYGKPMSLKLIGVNNRMPDQKIFEYVDNQRLSFVNSTWNHLVFHTPTSSLDVQYKLSCFPDYYGERCQVRCIPQNNDIVGHFSCDNRGNRICLSGWRGKFCTLRTCYKPCSHGICKDELRECRCEIGWSGDSCDIDLQTCFTRPCINGGTCYRGICYCLPGFYGRSCEHQIKPSSSSLSSILTPSFTTAYTTLETVPTKTIESTFNLHTAMTSVTQASLKSSPSFVHHSTFMKSSSVSSSSNYHFITDTSKLIEATSWLVLPSVTAVPTVPTATSKPNKQSTPLVVPMVVSFAVMVLLISLIVFLFLWKRSKFHRRKSQTSVTHTTETGYESSIRSVSSLNSVSTSHSLSPMLKKLFEVENLESNEPPDIDIISVIDYPVSLEQDYANKKSPTENSDYSPPPSYHHQKTLDVEKYTLQAVNRICWEVINGSKSRHKGKRRLNIRRESKEALVKSIHDKSQCSSVYSSSGYGSSRTSPKPHSATSDKSSNSLSTMSSNTSRNSLSDCFSPEDVYAYAMAFNCSETNNNNNNGNNNNNNNSSKNNNNNKNKQDNGAIDGVNKSSFDILEMVPSRESSSEGLRHTRQVCKPVKFEALPNFITYQEEEEDVI